MPDADFGCARAIKSESALGSGLNRNEPIIIISAANAQMRNDGNQYFEQSGFVQATSTYELAAKLWKFCDLSERSHHSE